MITRVLTWNLERQAPTSRKGRALSEQIRSHAPNVVCLTEAHAGSAEILGHHEIATIGVRWSPQKDSERKVVLGSLSPWSDVDDVGNDDLQAGGFITGCTDTPLGRVRVVGVCIPYHFASPLGQEPRSRAWTEHMRYLAGLGAYLQRLDDTIPLMILGDFNQYMPRIWGSKAAHERLLEALGRARIVTGGRLATVDRAAIDHIAVYPLLVGVNVSGIDEHDGDGKALSDHFGVYADVVATG